MKKTIAIFLMAAFLLSLAACSGSGPKPAENNVTPGSVIDTSTPKDEVTAETPPVETEPEPEPEPVSQALTPDPLVPIALDFADITLVEVGATDKVSIQTSEYSSTVSQEEEGSQAVYLMFEIKNKSNTAISSWYYFAGSVAVGQYTYTAENLSGVNASDHAPLKVIKYAVYSLIPDELFDTGEPFIFNIGFNEAFDIEWGAEVSSCEYQYEYTLIKNGDSFEVNGKTLGAEAEAVGETDADATQTDTPAETTGSLWMKSYYVDEFNQPTDEAYIANSTRLVGTFSNSATTDSKLLGDILVDAEYVAIMLYEYGRTVVKNSSSRYDEDYDIKMKMADGTIIDITGYIGIGGDRIIIDDVYKNDVINALSAAPVGDTAAVSFYIVQSERLTTTYLLLVPMSNFADAYQSLTK